MYHGGEHKMVYSLLFVSSEATTELNINYLHNPGTLFVKSYIYLSIICNGFYMET